MPVLKLPSALSDLLPFASNLPLGDPSQPNSQVTLKLPDQSHPFPIPNPADRAATLGTFFVSAGASSSVAIINSPSDPDPIGYFGLGATATPAADDAANAPAIEPPAKFDEQLAYVVVTGLSVSGKLSGDFTIGGSGALALDGGGSLDLSSCTAFPRSTPVLDALQVALPGFRTIFSASELLGLSAPDSPLSQPWQILSVGLQGNLNLSLEVKAASLAGAIADSVNAVLNQGGPFRFDASAAATVTVTFTACDGYRIFAQRLQAGEVSFAVKKQASTSLGLNAGLGLNVAISAPDLTAVVNAAFAQVNGVVPGTLDALLNAGGSAALTPEQQQSLKKILAKCRLTDAVGNGLEQLKAKLAAFREDLVKRLTPVVTAQFTYSWQRLTSDSLVASFRVRDEALPECHADILKLNLTRLLERQGNGVTFSKLLGQSVREVKLGFGFSFGFNGFVFLKSWDSKQAKFVELRSLAPAGGFLLQESFLGRRAYDASWMGSTQSHFVELDAAMDAPVSAPSLGLFHPRLSVAFTWENMVFSQILTAVADCGVVIGAFSTDDVEEARQALIDAGVDPKATGSASVTLVVNNASLRRLLPVVTDERYVTQVAPNAMARALGFHPDYPERGRATRRMQVYGRVFAEFLASEDLDLDTVSKLCGKFLPEVSLGGKVSTSLIRGESSTTGLAWSAQGIVRMADAKSLQAAIQGKVPACFAGLAQQDGDFRRVYPDCLEQFSTLAAQGYGSRIFASMLVLAAGLVPGGLDTLDRTVQLAWTEGETARTVVVRKGGI